MRFFAIVFFIVMSSFVSADIFDKKKSKLELSLSSESEISSDSLKGELSWDLNWLLEKPVKISKYEVNFSTKPYYKYKKTELSSEEEETTKIGLDAVKVSFDLGTIQPYFSTGGEYLDTTTKSLSGGSVSEDEVLSSFSYGIVIPFYRNSSVSITIYNKHKYEKIYESKVTDESGLKFSFDIFKAFDDE